MLPNHLLRLVFLSLPVTVGIDACANVSKTWERIARSIQKKEMMVTSLPPSLFIVPRFFPVGHTKMLTSPHLLQADAQLFLFWEHIDSLGDCCGEVVCGWQKTALVRQCAYALQRVAEDWLIWQFAALPTPLVAQVPISRLPIPVAQEGDKWVPERQDLDLWHFLGDGWMKACGNASRTSPFDDMHAVELCSLACGLEQSMEIQFELIDSLVARRHEDDLSETEAERISTARGVIQGLIDRTTSLTDADYFSAMWQLANLVVTWSCKNGEGSAFLRLLVTPLRILVDLAVSRWSAILHNLMGFNVVHALVAGPANVCITSPEKIKNLDGSVHDIAKFALSCIRALEAVQKDGVTRGWLVEHSADRTQTSCAIMVARALKREMTLACKAPALPSLKLRFKLLNESWEAALRHHASTSRMAVEYVVADAYGTFGAPSTTWGQFLQFSHSFKRLCLGKAASLGIDCSNIQFSGMVKVPVLLT
jgi:hypothetical protein